MPPKKTAAKRRKTATKKTKRVKKTTRRTKKRSTKKTAKKTTKKRTKKTTKKRTARKYSPAAQTEVAKAMRKFIKGIAVSGKAEVPVESREQAIAIGLSKARKKGAKVPKKKSSKK